MQYDLYRAVPIQAQYQLEAIYGGVQIYELEEARTDAH